MTQTDKPEQSSRSPGLLPSVAEVLFTVFIIAGCTSLDPKIAEIPPPEATQDQLLIQAFVSHYDRIGAETGSLFGEVSVDGDTYSLPGYCLGPSREDAGWAGTTAPAGSFREARGVLLSLSDGSLKDYEDRSVQGRIVIIEPLVSDLAPALHQARLFGASAVVAAPREDEGAAALADDLTSFRDPGLPVFFLSPQGAAQLRQLEGREAVLRFPVDASVGPWQDLALDFETSHAPGGEGGWAGELAGGLPFLPEQRREGTRRIQALQAALAEQHRGLRRPWRITGRPLVCTAEEWMRDILDQDRQPLPLLPWESRLAEAWRGRAGEAGAPDFYNTVMDRVEEWNREAAVRVDLDPRPSGADMTRLARDIRQFWVTLELNLLHGVISEGVMLMKSRREEELPRIFSPYLLSARAIPRFHPEAAAAAQRGGSDASVEKGERWLPDLGDLFLSLHLGLHRDDETRQGMIKELEYWERRSGVLLKDAEARLITMTDDLLFRIEDSREGLPQE